MDVERLMPRKLPHIRQSVMEVILLALCILLACSVQGFLTKANLLNVLRNVSMQGIIAFGMTAAIIAGEIDLSVGSAVAFAGCVTAWVTQFGMERCHMPPVAAVVVGMACALALGSCVGALTGYLRSRFRVPTFIATLAWLTVLKGASELITNGFPLTPFPDWFNFLGGGYWMGVPFPAILFLITFVIVHIVMHKTAFGRSVYAVGGNVEAARLSGLNVGGIKVRVMAIVGFCSALAGILQAAQIMSGSATTAQGWELDVISAVIIGGTSLLGGAGSVRGTLIGLVFLGVLVNGMTLMNVNEYWQHVVRGGLILTAVLINMAPGKQSGGRTETA
jgi:ribose/xylose/arabinose/galactoside ABC-type transport system permease subunit